SEIKNGAGPFEACFKIGGFWVTPVGVAGAGVFGSPGCPDRETAGASEDSSPGHPHRDCYPRLNHAQFDTSTPGAPRPRWTTIRIQTADRLERHFHPQAAGPGP